MIGQTLSHSDHRPDRGRGDRGRSTAPPTLPSTATSPTRCCLPTSRRTRSASGRFRREAHLLASLNHPNIAAIPSGKVKVLDFGLAKAWAGDTADRSLSSGALSQSPTFAHMGTMAGVILGTAAYMSPEQARGKPVDKRADVWSSACCFGRC